MAPVAYLDVVAGTAAIFNFMISPPIYITLGKRGETQEFGGGRGWDISL